MSGRKAAYWALTAPVALMMGATGSGYLSSSAQMVEAFTHLGYPLYFMTLLGTAKLLGVAALVYKRFPRLTEWAYAGFAFTLLGAAWSHHAAGDGAVKTVVPLVVLAFLLGSYRLWEREGA